MKRILLLASLLSLPALAQQPTRPAITGIAFARFYTTDPAAAQKFYESDDWDHPDMHIYSPVLDDTSDSHNGKMLTVAEQMAMHRSNPA